MMTRDKLSTNSTIPPEEQMVYSWNAINVKFFPRGRFFSLFQSKTKVGNASKNIVTNVSGIAEPGELLALMGASGAGKSTLLDCLTFRSSHNLLVTGERKVNGQVVDHNVMTFLSAYVQQDDIFLGNLTVLEHLQFAAKVVMNRGTSRQMRKERISGLLDDLDLFKCRNTIIGTPGGTKGLSGGERKRLAVATGLINNPPILFCDEPTSGLDSFMSKNVVTILKKLATQGRTIITTIHQPSSEVYFLFDKVMFLTQGQVAFLGTTANALNFFASIGARCPSNYNPADYFISRLAEKFEDSTPGSQPQQEFLAMVVDAFSKSRYSKDLMDEIHIMSKATDESARVPKLKRLSFQAITKKNLRYHQPWHVQFFALLVRSFLDIIKSKQLVVWKIVQTIAVALVFGVLFWNQGNDQDAVMNINGAIFTSSMYIGFQHIFTVIHVFADELPVFLREHYNGMYGIDAYFIAKSIVEVPIQIILPAVYASIVYFMINLNNELNRYLWHCLILIILANIAASFGYFIGICVANVSMALVMATPLVMPLILLSGILLNIESMSDYVSWGHYGSWYFYALETLLVNQWDGVTNIKCTRPNTTCPPNGAVVLGQYSYKPERFKLDLWILLSISTVYRLLALILLHIRVKIKG